MNNFIRIGMLSLLLILNACGAGSGEGLDENGEPITEVVPTEEPQTAAVSLERLVSDIFDNASLGGQRCTNCHSGASALGGLSLESASIAYANLVEVNANGNVSFQRVSPNNPDESFLILKLEGDPRAGSQMPLGQPALRAQQIQQVRDWIANGAPQSGSGNQAAKVNAVHSTTGTNSVEVSLHFSRPLQPLATELSMQVYGVDTNGHRQLVDSEFYSSRMQEPQTLLVSLQKSVDFEKALVVFNDPNFSTLLDDQGAVIDGDSNNIEGGVYQYEVRF